MSTVNTHIAVKTQPITTIGSQPYRKSRKVTSLVKNNNVSWLKPKMPISVREPSQRWPIGDGQR